MTLSDLERQDEKVKHNVIVVFVIIKYTDLIVIFAREPGLAGCPRDFPSALIPKHSITAGTAIQVKTDFRNQMCPPQHPLYHIYRSVPQKVKCDFLVQNLSTYEKLGTGIRGLSFYWSKTKMDDPQVGWGW